MDNCGILFHHFCSGFVRVSGKFLGDLRTADGAMVAVTETWTAASCQGVSPSLSPAVRVQLSQIAFSLFGCLCVNLIIVK